MTLGNWTKSVLSMQGFACDTDPALAAVAPWLRWTPLLSTAMIIAGTVLRSPAILWTFAVVALCGAAGWHPFDALFNHAVRPVVKVPQLPANPAPRRFAMALAGVWGGLAGVCFARGWSAGGLVAGGLLTVAAITVATSQFCLGSWVWRLFRPLQRPAM